MYRGYKAGSDRSGRGRLHFIFCMELVVFSVQPLIFFRNTLADSMGAFKGPIKKEPEIHAPNSSALDVNASNPTETISATG